PQHQARPARLPDRLDREPRGHLARGMPERLSRGGRRIRDDDRITAIAALADRRLKRDLPEQRNVMLLSRARPATVTEDLAALAAVGADEEAHVLDDPQDCRLD